MVSWRIYFISILFYFILFLVTAFLRFFVFPQYLICYKVPFLFLFFFTPLQKLYKRERSLKFKLSIRAKPFFLIIVYSLNVNKMKSSCKFQFRKLSDALYYNYYEKIRLFLCHSFCRRFYTKYLKISDLIFIVCLKRKSGWFVLM